MTSDEKHHLTPHWLLSASAAIVTIILTIAYVGRTALVAEIEGR